MRTHGWSGAKPADDDEAIARILDAARRRIDECGMNFGISDVAKDIGVTRQTVYRYFPSTETLMIATAVAEVGPFLDSLAAHVRKIHDPAEAVVEGIAHTLEQLPHEHYMSLLLTPGKASAFSGGVTSDIALSFGRSIVERFAVDWDAAGFSGDDLDQLVEFMLRIFQSLVIDPGRPPRHGKQLRTFLRRWVAPAITRPTTLQESRVKKPTPRTASTSATRKVRGSAKKSASTASPRGATRSTAI
ncbi:TetR/AcrR family transcriptional regulator [Mycolicibacter sp. MYC123]|uniref:TetR/AcrR family transcriptional regulator n=1 Tax=[Mycobacterium] zoologicum TaxID=2872311 RepID=A0ABU5YIF0_9MYCO|nr:TetR/AcrR family transcriptional regulator [Mycolicibacter sp. MYC123]MEB3049827.1 TetR/AcrR family transcriptional regulator [Mycolicibacter sp. MYC123]